MAKLGSMKKIMDVGKRVSDVGDKVKGGLGAMKGRARSAGNKLGSGKASGLVSKGEGVGGVGGMGGIGDIMNVRGGPIVLFLTLVRLLVKVGAQAIVMMPKVLKFLLVFGILATLTLGTLALAIWVLRRFHPRICLINRTAKFEGFMGTYLRDVEETVYDLRRGLSTTTPEALLLFKVSHADARALQSGTGCGPVPTSRSRPGAQCVLKAEEEVLRRTLPLLTDGRQPDEFNRDLETYFRFYTTLKYLDHWLYSFFARRDILNAPQFVREGDVDREAVAKFRAGFMRPMDELRAALRSVSRHAATWTAMPAQRWYTDGTFRFLLQVHMLNMLLNEYHAQIERSSNTRKALALTLQFNVWTLYYLPYAERVFTYRIPAIWIAAPRRFVNHWRKFTCAWQKLGVTLSLLPCRIAFLGDSAEGDKMCRAIGGSSDFDACDYKEMFVAGPDEKGAEGAKEKGAKDEDAKKSEAKDTDEEEEEEEDVIEGLGFLKTLKNVGTFFKMILVIGRAMVQAFRAITTDPLRAILMPFVVVIGLVLGLLVLLVYTMHSLLHLHAIYAFVYAWYMSFTLAIWLTIIEVVFVVLLCLAFVFIWLADLLTGGLVVKMMRCENLPNEWETRGGYAAGNKAVRLFGTTCCYPCAPRFRPFGPTCRRTPDHIPDFCPQQQIMRTLRTGRPFQNPILHGPIMFDHYPATGAGRAAFRTLRREEKERRIVAAFADARGFWTDCYMSLSRFDYVNRHVCVNVDRLPDDRYDAKSKMRSLCEQVYCEYRTRRAGFFRKETVMQSQSRRDRDCMCRGFDERRRKVEAALKEQGLSARQVLTRAMTRDRTGEATRRLGTRVFLMAIGVLALLAAVSSLFDVNSRLYLDRKHMRAAPRLAGRGAPGLGDLIPGADLLPFGNLGKVGTNLARAVL